MRIVVVLPAPFGPKSPKISPRATAKESPSTARFTAAFPAASVWRNSLARFSTRIKTTPPQPATFFSSLVDYYRKHIASTMRGEKSTSAVLRAASAAKNRIARENFSCRTQMIRKFLSFHLRANDSTKKYHGTQASKIHR